MGVADYGWIQDSGLDMAGCVTVVPGGDVAQVLAAFGAVEGTARAATAFDDVDDMHAGSSDPICVVELPDAVVVFENNGLQGARAEVLGPASKAGSASVASSFFWNVNAVTSFSAARRGKVVFSVELIGAEDDELLGVPRPLRRHVVSAGNAADLMLAAGLDLVHRWTRCDFTTAATASGTVYDTDPPPSDLRTWVPEHSHVRGMEEAPRRLTDMSDAELRSVAAWSCAAAAREAGVAEQAPVARALDQLAVDGRGTESAQIDGLARAASARQELFSRLRDLQEVNHDLPPHPFHQVTVDGIWQERAILSEVESLYLAQATWAYIALRHVAHDDPYSAAAACLDAASIVFSVGRTERGWRFTEDERGRRHSGSTANPRHEQFVRAASRLLSELPSRPDGAVDRATAALPRPFTEDERAAAVHADADAAARGEFAEWRIGP